LRETGSQGSVGYMRELVATIGVLLRHAIHAYRESTVYLDPEPKS